MSPLDKFGIGFGINVSKNKDGMKTRRHNHSEEKDHNQQGHGFKRTAPARISLSLKYGNTFVGYFFSCKCFGHKYIHYKSRGNNIP